jgi:hypothetical protein
MPSQPDLPVEGALPQLFVVVHVTNVGRRPVKWTGWGGNYHKPVEGRSSFLVVPVDLPQMLNEGASHSEHTTDVLTLTSFCRETLILATKIVTR